MLVCRLELDVVIDGEYLMGDTSMMIEGGGSKAYQLLYSPLVPKIHNGSVAFLNPKVQPTTLFSQISKNVMRPCIAYM